MIPSGADHVPLAVVTRGNCVEGIHYGSIVVADNNGEIISYTGSPDWQTFTRSSCKPLQALPLISHDRFDGLGLTPGEIAVICGSHSGEPGHVDTVKQLLEKIGLDEGHLGCGVHPPFYLGEIRKSASGREIWTELHHNCSGKHSGMLAQCKLLGVSTEGYLELEHPVQKAILSYILEYTGLEEGQIDIGIDGCSAPNFAMPLKTLACAYARLVKPDRSFRFFDVSRVIYSAMTSHPFLVSGTNRLDLVLMQTGNGDWLSKMGAEAVQCIGIRSRGWGIAIKIIDGSTRAMNKIVLEILRQLQLLDDVDAGVLRNYARSEIKNYRGLVIGDIEPVFTLQA